MPATCPVCGRRVVPASRPEGPCVFCADKCHADVVATAAREAAGPDEMMRAVREDGVRRWGERFLADGRRPFTGG